MPLYPDNYDYIQQSDQLEPENPNNIPLTPELYEYQPPENNILLDYQPNTEVNNLSEDYWNQVESEDNDDNINNDNNVSAEVREQILDELPNIDQKNVEADELLRIEEDVVVDDNDNQPNENNFSQNNINDNSDLTDYQLIQ